jgi:soluble lytic murein transglycosylase-like protein
MEQKVETKDRTIWSLLLQWATLVVLVMCFVVIIEYKGIINDYQKQIETFNFLSSETQIQKRVTEQIILKDLQKDREFIEKIDNAIEQIQPRLDPTTRRMIAISTITESRKKKLDPYLILAVMFIESSIDPLKESNMGAVGLMQVRYQTWRLQPELQSNGVDKKFKLFWVNENIKSGTDVFDKYYTEANRDIFATLYRYLTGSTQFPKDKAQFDVHYANKIFYYTFIIRDIVEGGKRHELAVQTRDKKN